MKIGILMGFVKYGVSEDFDVNIHAVKAGFKGRFIRYVRLYHDQSHINTYRKPIKYFYGQFVRTAMIYFKCHSSLNKFTTGSRKTRMIHPLQFIFFILKQLALIHGWKEWNKYIRGT